MVGVTTCSNDFFGSYAAGGAGSGYNLPFAQRFALNIRVIGGQDFKYVLLEASRRPFGMPGLRPVELAAGTGDRCPRIRGTL